MEEEGIERQEEGVHPHLRLVEGDGHAQAGVEQHHDQEDARVREEDQARQQEVGLAEVPLLGDLEGDQLPQGDQLLPWLSLSLLRALEL